MLSNCFTFPSTTVDAAKFVIVLFADFQQQDLKICGVKFFLLVGSSEWNLCTNEAQPIVFYSKGYSYKQTSKKKRNDLEED